MNYLVGYSRACTILFLPIFLSLPSSTFQHTPYAQYRLAYSRCPGHAACSPTLPQSRMPLLSSFSPEPSHFSGPASIPPLWEILLEFPDPQWSLSSLNLQNPQCLCQSFDALQTRFLFLGLCLIVSTRLVTHFKQTPHSTQWLTAMITRPLVYPQWARKHSAEHNGNTGKPGYNPQVQRLPSSMASSRESVLHPSDLHDLHPNPMQLIPCEKSMIWPDKYLPYRNSPEETQRLLSTGGGYWRLEIMM